MEDKFKWGMDTAKGIMNVANTLQELQNPNTNGGKRLLNIIRTIKSWGGSAANESLKE